MAEFDLTCALEGQPIEWESKKVPTRGGSIVFVLHAPTQAEGLLASKRAGIKRGDDGKVIVPPDVHIDEETYIVEKSRHAYRYLARLCIDDVRGLDGWPERPHRRLSDSIKELTEEAWSKLLLGPDKSTVLVDEIGEYVNRMELDDAKKKPSAPPSSGHTSNSSTQSDTQTTAAPADAATPPAAGTGSVTEAASHSTTSEVSGSAPAPSH